MSPCDMGSGRRQRLRAIFGAVLDASPAARAARLAEACGGDADLLAEIESLLAAHAAAEGFLTGPEEEAPSPSLTGQRIGPYRIVRKLGSGGMGDVYLAVREDGELRRRVALKALKPGLDSEAIVRRFRAERQILAALEHPNIARLLDGGTTERGYPYFVMEYVEGQPIDVYCQERRLTVRERIELFLTVCSAVQLAHRNLIVHRDLKPSNILVTQDGTSKLLDFGIAKLLNPELSTEALGVTALGAPPMTPDYASPEQILGEPVTTASDVYSLGVLLYLLLTGAHPYRSGVSSAAEIQRRVTGEEPVRPSLACGGRSGRELAGDLDNIVVKALRREPGLRYPSVEQLADDLRRHLDGRPVLARPGTLSYRASKFLRRHRAWAATAAVLFLALVGAGIALGVQATRLARERDRAELERRRAEQVTAFLTDIFDVSTPGRANGGTVTARELLDEGARKLDTGLVGQPEVRAELMRAIGLIYWRLGLYDRAAPRLRTVLAERRRRFGEESPQVAESLADLGLIALETGDPAAAERLFREALTLRRKAFGAENPDVAQSLGDLAGVLWATGRYEEAEATFRKVLALRRKIFGGEHREIAKTLSNLGVVLRARGRHAEAEAMLRESLAVWSRLSSPDSLDAADVCNNLGLVLQARGRLSEAERLMRRSLAQRRRWLGPGHPRVAASLNNLGAVLAAQGRFVEAEPLLQEALAQRREILGPEHFEVSQSLENLAIVAQGEGRYAQAERHAREALEIRRQIFGDEHPQVADAERLLALALKSQGELPAAEQLLRDVLAQRRGRQSADHLQVARALVDLAGLLNARGDLAAGEATAREALDLLRIDAHPERTLLAEAEGVLGESLAGLGRREEAVRLLEHSHALTMADRGESAPETRASRARLASLH